MKVPFYRHHLGEAETTSMVEALSSPFLTAGPRTATFESQFANYLNVKRVVGLYSCTSALMLALRGLGVGPKDEVITTPMTFIATPNSVLEVGATPPYSWMWKPTPAI
ncbi:MAG: DegT/DnrJ/EryC1/StrS aminotransferase family protein [Magnetococcales bacterium]|nr:DegT/DnrJ/EryC1/StrS aminotransferase family protein [Magnetococcales bacterium]